MHQSTYETYFWTVGGNQKLHKINQLGLETGSSTIEVIVPHLTFYFFNY